MYPFIPFWISCGIWLLIFRFENTDNFTLAVPTKVASRTTLCDHLWVYALLHSDIDAFNYSIKFVFGHPTCAIFGSQGFGGSGSNAFRSLKDRVMDFQLLLLVCPGPGLSNLKLCRDFVCPSFQSCIDSLDVHSRGIAPHPPSSCGLRPEVGVLWPSETMPPCGRGWVMEAYRGADGRL